MRLAARNFLPRVLILFVLAAMAVSIRPAAAYDNPDLAASSAAWLRSVKAQFGNRTDQQAAQESWGEARRWAQQRTWGRASALYLRAAGLGMNDYAFWLQMSQAMSSREPADHEAALRAAFLGYQQATDDNQRALALHHVAYRYQLLNRGEKAIEAYEESLSLAENSTARQRLDALLAQYRHHITNAYAQAETDEPRLCLEFSRELLPADQVRYRDYVVVEPTIVTTFHVAGNTLCIGGADHGESYKVTVRAGLPSATELSLVSAREFTVAVPDRAPTLGFRGDAHILPRVSRQGIPLTSVNVGAAKLRLYRIGDRNLVNQINDSELRALLNRYEAQRVANTEGELVWEGEIGINEEENREVTTAIPAESILRDPRPGIYILTAAPADEDEEASRYNALATQWLVLTDIALSTFQGTDGLHVFARSYDDAEPMRRVTVQLIARNNEVLGEATTDRQGRAHFEAGLLRGEGGNRPVAVLARGREGDFAFLDLSRPAFDLSDRGVAGRVAPGPVDAFMYPERGVYRPGETVHLTALLRSDAGEAVRDIPLTLRLRRPDGVVAQRFTLSADDAREGGYTLDIPMSQAAHTGRWSVQAYVDPDGQPVGATSFQVEDFVPERLEMTLAAEPENLTPGTATNINIEGRFLYGAPAAELRVEGEVTIRQDMNPYPDWEGYHFGLVTESWDATRRDLEAVTTDAQGRASLSVAIDALPETTRPTRAEVRVTLNETGGRAIQRVISVPVRGQEVVLGIKREGDGGYVSRGEDAQFSLIALDGQGNRRAMEGLRYRLVRENYQYQWYFQENRWRYRVIRTDEPISEGELSVAANEAGTLSFDADEGGSYRLIVDDPNSEAATSVRYYVGWFTQPGAENVPDRLSVTLDKDSYSAGDTAQVNIQPPFDGQVHVVVASDRLLVSRMVDVPRDGRTIEIDVEEEWGPGTYVTATAYRPMSQRDSRGPARAIGVAHIGRDFSDRTLNVEIEAPEQITPRQRVEMTVRVAGARNGTAYVTLAAVDEGILSLTGYETPNPVEHYFGKRQLAMDIRDAYGFLIDPYAGQLGEIRQGGDAAARDRHLGGLDASSIRTVSLFSGLVEVDDGEARIAFDVPDFNGRLRLMAVAYDREAVGRAERDMTVRDPLVSVVTLPRFLAPGDKARVSVSLHNVDGPAGQYTVTMDADGEAARFNDARFEGELAADARQSLSFELEGQTVGVATINLRLSGPEGFEIVRSWPIAVRPAQATVSRYQTREIGAGESESYNRALFSEMLPGTGRAYVTVASYPDWGMAGLIRSLDRYPYGCSEQVTSRALPLLYLVTVAQTIGVDADEQEVRQRVQSAINRLSMMQRPDGAFGLWGAFDEREDWLTAYVMDFLTQAKEQDYLVPDPMFERGMARLDAAVRLGEPEQHNLHVLAYAHYVLARNRAARIGDLRYFHDTYLQNIPTALAKAQIGAALALYGDQDRAENAFAEARLHRQRPPLTGPYWSVAYRDYGSSLRDSTGVLYFITQANNRSIRTDDLIQEIGRDRANQNYLSTQEQAWLLLAANEIGGSGAPMRLTVGGEQLDERTQPVNLRLDEARMGEGTAVENRGTTPVWASVSISGIPATDLPAEENGFTINRTYYTLDGQRADLTQVEQSQVLVAIVEVRATGRGNHQAMVVDLLPSGFEIENARLGGRDVSDMNWLPDLTTPRTVEPRDDRFVAAVDVQSRNEPYYLAYIVRAVTPGEFRLPAAHVEDMYRPNYFARMAMGNVTIRPRQ